MFSTARDLGVGVMAYGPMAHGLLTGTFKGDQAFGPEDWRRRGVIFGQTLFGPNLPANVGVVEKLKGVASDLGTSLPRLALAWVLRNPAVTVALSGCRTVAEIEENVKALEVKIPNEALARIDDIMKGAAGQVNEVPGRHHLPPVAVPA
jgi:aryl-alcohol dehydrogenase-like predicted oxidoreductase